MKYLRVFTRLGGVFLVIALGLAACAGEAFITYEGSVSAGGTAGVTFDATQNPGGAPPVSGATVRVAVCVDPCPDTIRARAVTTDEDGLWGPVDRVIGGLVGTDHIIQIEVSAEGYQPLLYEVIFETTSDPVDGELYMNVTLQPLGNE